MGYGGRYTASVTPPPPSSLAVAPLRYDPQLRSAGEVATRVGQRTKRVGLLTPHTYPLTPTHTHTHTHPHTHTHAPHAPHAPHTPHTPHPDHSEEPTRSTPRFVRCGFRRPFRLRPCLTSWMEYTFK